jgi:hypothetical protein
MKLNLGIPNWETVLSETAVSGKGARSMGRLTEPFLLCWAFHALVLPPLIVEPPLG